MTKIKLCGLYQERDIDYANEAMPDYVGFVLLFPKSHRCITADTAESFKKRLDPAIQTVGVFVDAPPQRCAEYANSGIIDLIQLHGSENVDYINSLRKTCKAPIIKAIKVSSLLDLEQAAKLPVDYLLLDHGTGTGKPFDHRILDGAAIPLPYFLAGGLSPQNISEIIQKYRPYAVDLSSGIETDRKKDREKMIAAVRAAREAEQTPKGKVK